MPSRQRERLESLRKTKAVSELEKEWGKLEV